MVDDVDYIIQERNIVGNEDKGIFIVLQVTFEPIDMLRIQVVGWLVQEKDIWFSRSNLAKRTLVRCPPERGRYICLHAKVHDPKSPRHFIYLGIQGIEIPTL